ncbi:MAG: hypothetical protein GX638_10725 [Crenarchaeota archaeon]|nr:hypothetical protein [Thermoproteota archaeon]
MTLPSWLPTPITKSIFKDVNNYVSFSSDYYYEFFKKDLLEPSITFEDKNLVLNSSKLDCSIKFVKSGKNCNNTLFNCSNCVFDKREVLFCHIVSKRDKNIIARLKSRYRNYEQSRVPGLLELDRLEKIRWVKPVIKEYDENKPPEIVFFDDLSSEKERIIYLWLKEFNFVVILGQNLWDSKQKNLIYIKTAYVIDNDETKFMFQRLHRKYKKRLELNSGVL